MIELFALVIGRFWVWRKIPWGAQIKVTWIFSGGWRRIWVLGMILFSAKMWIPLLSELVGSNALLVFHFRYRSLSRRSELCFFYSSMILWNHKSSILWVSRIWKPNVPQLQQPSYKPSYVSYLMYFLGTLSVTILMSSEISFLNKANMNLIKCHVMGGGEEIYTCTWITPEYVTN